MHVLQRLNHRTNAIYDGDTIIVWRGDCVSDAVWHEICKKLGSSPVPMPEPTDGAAQIRMDALMQATERAMSGSARAEPTFRKRR